MLKLEEACGTVKPRWPSMAPAHTNLLDVMLTEDIADVT